MVDHVPDDARQVRPTLGCGDLEHVVAAVVCEELEREPVDLGLRRPGRCLDLDRDRGVEQLPARRVELLGPSLVHELMSLFHGVLLLVAHRTVGARSASRIGTNH